MPPARYDDDDENKNIDVKLPINDFSKALGFQEVFRVHSCHVTSTSADFFLAGRFYFCSRSAFSSTNFINALPC